MKHLILIASLFAICQMAFAQKIVLNNGTFEYWRFVNNRKDTIVEKYPISQVSYEYQFGKKDITFWYNTGLNQKLIYKGLWKNIIYSNTYDYWFNDFVIEFNLAATNFAELAFPAELRVAPVNAWEKSLIPSSVSSSSLNPNMPLIFSIKSIATTYDVDYSLQEFINGTWITIWQFERFKAGFVGIVTTPPLRIRGLQFQIVKSFPGSSWNTVTHTYKVSNTNSLVNNRIQYFERSIDPNIVGQYSHSYNIAGFNKINIGIKGITGSATDAIGIELSYNNIDWLPVEDMGFNTTSLSLRTINNIGANYLRIKINDDGVINTPRQLDYIIITASEL